MVTWGQISVRLLLPLLIFHPLKCTLQLKVRKAKPCINDSLFCDTLTFTHVYPFLLWATLLILEVSWEHSPELETFQLSNKEVDKCQHGQPGCPRANLWEVLYGSLQGFPRARALQQSNTHYFTSSFTREASLFKPRSSWSPGMNPYRGRVLTNLTDRWWKSTKCPVLFSPRKTARMGVTEHDQRGRQKHKQGARFPNKVHHI